MTLFPQESIHRAPGFHYLAFITLPGPSLSCSSSRFPSVPQPHPTLGAPRGGPSALLSSHLPRERQRPGHQLQGVSEPDLCGGQNPSACGKVWSLQWSYGRHLSESVNTPTYQLYLDLLDTGFWGLWHKGIGFTSLTKLEEIDAVAAQIEPKLLQFSMRLDGKTQKWNREQTHSCPVPVTHTCGIVSFSACSFTSCQVRSVSQSRKTASTCTSHVHLIHTSADSARRQSCTKYLSLIQLYMLQFGSGHQQ